MAAKFRFFNIGQANAEIERLDVLVADRDNALAAAQERITSLESVPKSPDPALAQLQSDLQTARQTIGTLEAQVKAKDAEIATAKASVEKQASVQALTIVAEQGAAPIPSVPSPTPAADKPAKAETKLRGKLRVAAAIRKEMQLPD